MVLLAASLFLHLQFISYKQEPLSRTLKVNEVLINKDAFVVLTSFNSLCLIRRRHKRPKRRPKNSILSVTMAASLVRRVGKLQPAHSVFLLCDIQERFRDVIWHFPQVIRTAKLLTSVGKLLEIPTIATEQYPKAFGPTVSKS